MSGRKYLEKTANGPGFAEKDQVLTILSERFEKLDLSLRPLDLDAVLRHSGEIGAVPTLAAGVFADGKLCLCVLGCRISDAQVAPELVRAIESKRRTGVPMELDLAVDSARSEESGIYVQLRATAAAVP
jgi:hypothetical protein